MKFLKFQTTSKYSPSDNAISVNPYGRVVMDTKGGLMLPKGTSAQRPDLVGGRQPGTADGTIRYNTDITAVEAYVGGNWELVVQPAASAITVQTLGPGDGTETVFGPVFESTSANNVLCLVENVLQIPTTNFTLEQSVGGNLTGPNAPYADGYYFKFTSPVPYSKYLTTFYGFSN
jgi:hypothetical protein